jgi:peptidoglycan pentaglycine glycine transferase (the first glycine)
MEIKEITNIQEWNKFLSNNDSGSFLQAWEWGELQKKMGYSVNHLGLYENGDLNCIAQTITIKSKRGNFLFVPHGPVIKSQSSKLKVQSYLSSLKNYLIKLAKKEGCSFIRIAPLLEDKPENRQIFSDMGFKISPIYMHAERVWILPLNKDEDEILSGMRKTTRYLIRKAPKDRVVIEKRTDEKALDDFWEIYKITAKRENFTPFSKKFILHEFREFVKTGNAIFLFGKVDRKYLASALIVFTKSSGFYHQGASFHTKYPATYALQWEAIKEAKKRGCSLYNFWGILQPGRSPKNWGGLTLFKQGFGGRQIDYVPTHDLVLSPVYYMTWAYENLLKIKRGV